MFLLQFYVLHTINNYSRLSEDDLFTQLSLITEMADDGADTAESIGILTTENRDTWAKTRLHLMEGEMFCIGIY